MSLFNTREWWVSTLTTDEEYDEGCLCVANIDNDSNGLPKIITGSLQGVLRIFFPRQRDYQLNDLMLEEELGDPILQVEAGRFLSTSNGLALAVLHPRKLTVYTVLLLDGDQNQGNFFALQRAYEHKLPRNAYNFVIGPFGGVYDRDYICVQSMDGCLSFYEQERHTFDRILPDALVPGPICYIPHNDSFVVYTAGMELKCYKYVIISQALGSAPVFVHSTTPSDPATMLAAGITPASMPLPDAPDAPGEGAADPAQMGPPGLRGKKLQEEWALLIGEHVLGICVGRCSKQLVGSQSDVVVLGTQTLYYVRDSQAEETRPGAVVSDSIYSRISRSDGPSESPGCLP